jgi:hypothetical protein
MGKADNKKRSWWGNKNKGGKKFKKGCNSGQTHDECSGKGDNDDGDDRDGRSGEAHGSSFQLDEVKTTDEYLRKIDGTHLPKKKWAVCFGYLGSNYQGLQINPDTNTVEKHLEKALMLGKLELILILNATDSVLTPFLSYF